jgi:hypothetical protein
VDVFGDTKKKLLSELDDPTAAALREYIKAAFPTAKLEPVVSETKGGYFLVSERSAEYSKEAISKFLEKLAAVANQPTFDLAIVSAQSPAQFDMWPDVGNAYSTATDGTGLAITNTRWQKTVIRR